MQLRETGSITLHAPRDKVYDILARSLAAEPGLRGVPAERLDAARANGESTFILRESAEGTRLIHARTSHATLFAQRPREELREQVEAELFRIQRLIDALD